MWSWALGFDGERPTNLHKCQDSGLQDKAPWARASMVDVFGLTTR